MPDTAQVKALQLVEVMQPAGITPDGTPGALTPVGSIRMVGAKVEDFGTRVSLTLVGTPSENLLVMFSVRLSSSK